MSDFFNKLYKITRVIIIIAPILLLGWLIKSDLVLSGQIEFTYDFSRLSPVITELFPANRLSPIFQAAQNKSYWQQIQQEPVYFETRLPQTFDQAAITVTYKNEAEPLIQLGLSTMGEADWNYAFKPLENLLLDNLEWPRIQDERGTLWQRQKKYLSLDQFFDQLDNLSDFAAYNYPVDRKFKLPDYQPKGNYTIFNKTLRGYHSFYTYIKNEPLDFTFTVQDINRQEGPDYLAVKVYNDQNIKIYEKKIEDDGYISKLDPASLPREIPLYLEGLPEGAYKIILDCEDEFFFRQIKTKQRYLTFIDRLYLVDSLEYADGLVGLNYKPTVIYSTMPRLGFATAHPAGLQYVGINKEVIEIKELHQNYYLTPSKVPATIYVEKNDLKIFGRGLMALSEAMYFNPEIYNLRDLAELSSINYLITDYHVPQLTADGWKTNTVKFDLTNAKISNRKLRFVISAAELNSRQGLIPIKEIKVSFSKKPLSWPEFWDKTVNYIKKKF